MSHVPSDKPPQATDAPQEHSWAKRVTGPPPHFQEAMQELLGDPMGVSPLVMICAEIWSETYLEILRLILAERDSPDLAVTEAAICANRAVILLKRICKTD